ncbi:hydroxyethylthiazole kinase [Peribacillus sp. SCS-37]|uniref:hydroxyethylthiazole kinase n=1 Tax=Paraperibacillus esterisolvens TaxID=3115296 RepID=UPI0039064D4E
MEKEEIGRMLEKLRARSPLVHNITNTVVSNFTANGLLAIGASPVMAQAPEEAAEMAEASDALVLNIGTLSSQLIKAMIIAGKAANGAGVPVVLDPVGTGATEFRTNAVKRIMGEVKISILRGNAAEIANAAGENWEIKGVDSVDSERDMHTLGLMAAKKLNTTIVITGKNDIVTDGSTAYVNHTGHHLLTKVTGTGCLLTSVIGAFSSIESCTVKASLGALTLYGAAAERAAAAASGPGSLQVLFLDELYNLDPNEVQKQISYTKTK